MSAQAQAMEAAAHEAAKELKTLPPEHVRTVAEWWERNFGSPAHGHKRLGRALPQIHPP